MMGMGVQPLSCPSNSALPFRLMAQWLKTVSQAGAVR